jgi:beta-1,4-mannosyl-glycoprotein beta-1,4-N-acetylglucosaminyltransferase
MVIDLFSYNGEADVLELRLNILDQYVDKFIICEAQTTFSGNLKLLQFEQQRERFKKWAHKIEYFVINDEYTPEQIEEARNSKYTNGQDRWMHEYLQKEAIKYALIDVKDDDIVYVGDVDEIWEHKEPNGIEKLKLRVYTYYLNMRSSEEFWGPIRAYYKDLRDKCFNDIRNNPQYRTEDYQGWHFTNMGGLLAVKQKAIDQYDNIVFNGQIIYEGIDANFGIRDYIGRDFKLEVDEKDWPPWLVIHREEFAKLLK